MNNSEKFKQIFGIYAEEFWAKPEQEMLEWISKPSNEDNKGEWLEKEVFDSKKGKIRQWQSAKCSVCGKYHTTPYLYYFGNYNFCPNCGSEMRGINENA